MLTIPWKPVQMIPAHDEMLIHYARDGEVIFFSSTRCWTQRYCTRCGKALAPSAAPAATCPDCAPPPGKDNEDEKGRDAVERMFESVFGPGSSALQWSVRPL